MYVSKKILAVAQNNFKEAFFSEEIIEFILDSTFTYNTYDVDIVAHMLLNSFEQPKVRFFYPSWWRRTFNRNNIRAYCYPENMFPTKSRLWNVVFLNRLYPGGTVHNIAGTLAHEYCHLAGFGHGGNKPHGTLYDNSVPLKIGKFVKEYSEKMVKKA